MWAFDTGWDLFLSIVFGNRFSFAQFQTRIDAFMEMLLERKNL